MLGTAGSAFRDLDRNSWASRLAFYLYFFEWELAYDSQTDWRSGATASGGSSDLTSGGRTVATMKKWWAPDRSLRSPEVPTVGVTDQAYQANIGTPSPAPTDQRGKGMSDAAVSIYTDVAGEISAKLLFRCTDANSGRTYSTDWANLTNWTNGNNGGTGSVSALNPRLQVVQAAAVAGTEVSRWTSHNTPRDFRGKVIVVPIKKLGVTAANYDVGSVILSKAQNTGTDPLYDGASGFNGVEVSCKTDSAGHSWRIEFWVNGTMTGATLGSNPNVGDGILVIELNAGGTGIKVRLRDTGTSTTYTLFDGTVATLSGTSWYLNCVMRSTTTVSRDVILGRDETAPAVDKGLRVCKSKLITVGSLATGMVAELLDSAGAVLASATAVAAGNVELDCDAIAAASNPFLNDTIPLKCKLRLKDTDGTTVLGTSQLFVRQDVTVSGETQAAGVYPGDTVNVFADPTGTIEYASVFQAAAWVSPYWDSLCPTGWDRTTEWYQAIQLNSFYDRIYSASGDTFGIPASLKLYEPCESAEAVARNGGALIGGAFRAAKHGNGLFCTANRMARYPNTKIGLTTGWIACMFTVRNADGTSWAINSGTSYLWRTDGGTGYLRCKYDVGTETIYAECSNGTNSASLSYVLTAADKAKSWLFVLVYWTGSVLGLNVEANAQVDGTYYAPTGITGLVLCDGGTILGGTIQSKPELGLDHLVSRSDAAPSAFQLYAEWNQALYLRTADTISGLGNASWQSANPVAPEWDLASPPVGRYCQGKIEFNDHQNARTADADTNTSQNALPSRASVFKLAPRARFRVGKLSISRRGSIRRSIEESSVVGLHTTSGYQYQCSLNNEDGWANVNVLDSAFNNVRLFDAPLRVAAGYVDEDGAEQIALQGKFYVDSWGSESPDSEFSISASDLWSRVADKDLTAGYTYLALQLPAESGGSPTSMQIQDDPTTAWFPSAGYVNVDGEIIQYTGVATGPSRLTGINGNRGKFNTVNGAHEQETPVRLLYQSVAVDSLLDSITKDLGLDDGESQLSGHDGPVYKVRTTRREIRKANGTVTDAPLLGSVDTGDGYGQIGRPPANLIGLEGAIGITDAPTNLSPNPPHGLMVVRRVNYFGGNGGVTRGAELWLCRPDASEIVHLYCVQSYTVNPANYDHPQQCAVRIGAPEPGIGPQRWGVLIFGVSQPTPGTDNAFAVRAVVGYDAGNPSRLALLEDQRDHPNSPTEVNWGTIRTGASDGPGLLMWSEDEGKLYYVTLESTQVRIYEITNPPTPDSAVSSWSAPTITLKATLSSYKNATGFCRIAGAKNPLDQATARYVLAAQRTSDSEPVLVLLSSAWAVVGSDSQSVRDCRGLAFVQSRVGILGNTLPVSFLLAGWRNPEDIWPPTYPIGIACIFDWFFPHVLVKASPAPAIKRNGTAQTAGTDYKLDLSGSVPKISVEKLAGVLDQYTASYDFTFSASHAYYAGMRGSEAINAACMIARFSAYLTEDEVFRAEPAGLPRMVSEVLMTHAARGLGLANLESLSLSLGRNELRNRMSLTKANPYDPEAPVTIIRDVSATQPSTTSFLNTIDLYGYKDVEAENRWIYALADAQAVIDLHLAWLDLKLRAQARGLLQAALQLADVVAVQDSRSGIGVGGTVGKAHGNLFKVVAISKDFDQLASEEELREL